MRGRAKRNGTRRSVRTRTIGLSVRRHGDGDSDKAIRKKSASAALREGNDSDV